MHIYKDPPTWTKGWKVFKINHWSGAIYGKVFKGRARQEGKWLKEQNWRSGGQVEGKTFAMIHSAMGLYYECGWHVYRHKKDAMARLTEGTVVKKIKCRKPIADGLELSDFGKFVAVGVFREIFIEPLSGEIFKGRKM